MHLHVAKIVSTDSRKCFIQTKKEREAFDSYKMLLTAKSKEYMSREELAKIESGVI